MKEIENLADSTVADIVINDFRAAEIFKRYGIDFSYGGRRKMTQVCEEKQLDIQDLENEIHALENQIGAKRYDFNKWSLSFLIDYILNIHHAYINNSLSSINELAERVAKAYGQNHPEVIEINFLWTKVMTELSHHMKKEELVLFPYIRSMEKYQKGELKQFPHTQFGTIKGPMRVEEQEHKVVGDLIFEIEHTSLDFTLPEYACDNFKMLYGMLKEFRDDLHQHMHLENNLLFPKAALLEEKLKQYN